MVYISVWTNIWLFYENYSLKELLDIAANKKKNIMDWS